MNYANFSVNRTYSCDLISAIHYTIVTFKLTVSTLGVIEDSLPIPLMFSKKVSGLC